MTIRKLFFTGLALLLPLALTIWVTIAVLDLVTKPFLKFAEGLFIAYEFLPLDWLRAIPEPLLFRAGQLIIVLALVVLAILIGAIARAVVVKTALRQFDTAIHQIPMINKIYRATQETVNTVLAPDSRAFRQVVMVPFPHPGALALGFMSSHPSDSDPSDEIAVFIPTVPNPMMGMLVRFKPGQITYLDTPVDEAFKALVSCGLTCPVLKSSVVP